MRRFPKAKNRLKTTERGLYFRLCDEHFPGITGTEMLARLSSQELTDWIAYLGMKDEAAKKAADDARRNTR